MKIFLRTGVVAVALWMGVIGVAQAGEHFWRVMSPDHGQTFAYGSEQNRAWAERGRDRHLVVLMTYTNDPFVDREAPRETDNFTFSFPGITLGPDGKTFSYRAPDGRLIPVASRQEGFLGIRQIRLLPNVTLEIRKPHGYLTLTLQIEG